MPVATCFVSVKVLCSRRGTVVAKEADKNAFGPFLYLWLALSVLLNVSGIASIVDGFVHWVSFFRDFLDIYRHLIREPLSWAVYLVWPCWWWKIPPWVFDLFVIDAALFFGANIVSTKYHGRSLVAEMFDSVRDFFLTPIIFVAQPLILLGMYFYPLHERDKSAVRDCLLYTAAVFATVIVLAFLNWQLQHIGS